jgi:hypothetical protein
MGYWGLARSLDTGKYYTARAVFQQNHANVRLDAGKKKLDLTLDEENIEDPEEVVATDPRGSWWARSFDGLDERPKCSETLILAGSAAPQRKQAHARATAARSCYFRWLATLQTRIPVSSGATATFFMIGIRTSAPRFWMYCDQAACGHWRFHREVRI